MLTTRILLQQISNTINDHELPVMTIKGQAGAVMNIKASNNEYAISIYCIYGVMYTDTLDKLPFEFERVLDEYFSVKILGDSYSEAMKKASELHDEHEYELSLIF